MSVECEIKFYDPNPDKEFYSGQTVSGVVEINVRNQFKIRKLYLSIEGFGECEWMDSLETKDSEGTTHTDHTSFQGRVQYLNSMRSFIENDMELTIGHHTYDFTFVLPPELPSSLMENRGQVRYKARIVFARPWSTDLNFDFDFKVTQPIDLNTDSACNVPCEQEEIKNFCCLFCASEPVIFTVSLPRAGYIVGETIPIKAIVNNQSSVEIQNLLTTFTKITTYHCQTPHEQTKEEQTVLYKMTEGESIKSGKREYEVSVKVPQTVPSTWNTSIPKAVDVKYELQVKAKAPGCHMSPVVTFPIIIGTIPVSSAQNDNQNNIQSYPIAQNFSFPTANINENSSASAKPQPSAPILPLETNAKPKPYDKPIGFVLPADQINDF